MSRLLSIILVAFVVLALFCNADARASRKNKNKSPSSSSSSSNDVAKDEKHYPFTDPHNLGAWVQFEPMTDEFSGNSLDLSKWFNHNPGWLGRAPGLFMPSNVKVANGNLQLWTGYQALNASMEAKGFKNYTTSAVQSKAYLKYGYCEIKAKLGSSKISSAFWFSNSDGHGDWTEIDVFEESGPLNQQEQYYHELHENTHIFKLQNTPENQIASKCHCTQNSAQSDCSSPFSKTMSFHDFSSDFHVFGMNWTDSHLITYLDNQQMRNIPNYCLHYELKLQFDRETMPDWMGLPSPSVLPDQPYQIQYVRTWTQQ